MVRIIAIALTIWCLPPKSHSRFPQECRVAACAWDSTKNWKIYHLPNTNRIIRISVDSLRYIENLPLNEDSIHALLCRVKKRDVQGPIPFQGAFLTSYETSGGTTVKVLVSASGGFIYVPRNNEFFEVPEDPDTFRSDWLNFFSNTYMLMEK